MQIANTEMLEWVIKHHHDNRDERYILIIPCEECSSISGRDRGRMLIVDVFPKAKIIKDEHGPPRPSPHNHHSFR
jgi:hypothetical protein